MSGGDPRPAKPYLPLSIDAISNSFTASAVFQPLQRKEALRLRQPGAAINFRFPGPGRVEKHAPMLLWPGYSTKKERFYDLSRAGALPRDSQRPEGPGL